MGWLLVGGSADPAFAFRPFTLTDASVADAGQMELECGPVGYLVDGEGRFFVVPAAVLNVGLAGRWEVVMEGRQFFLLGDVARRYTLRDAGLSVKHVVRPGGLHKGDGPSVGFEVGLLLPGAGADSGVGAGFTGLLSQRWSAGSIHLNASLEMTRTHRLADRGGAVVEGPPRWKVRPVAEFVVEHDMGLIVSSLAGAIWNVRATLSLDAGWLVARSRSDDQREFRAGFTWAIPLGSGKSASPIPARSSAAIQPLAGGRSR